MQKAVTVEKELRKPSQKQKVIKIWSKSFIWNCATNARYFQCAVHSFQLRVGNGKLHIPQQSEMYPDGCCGCGVQCVPSGQLISYHQQNTRYSLGTPRGRNSGIEIKRSSWAGCWQTATYNLITSECSPRKILTSAPMGGVAPSFINAGMTYVDKLYS